VFSGANQQSFPSVFIQRNTGPRSFLPIMLFPRVLSEPRVDSFASMKYQGQICEYKEGWDLLVVYKGSPLTGSLLMWM